MIPTISLCIPTHNRFDTFLQKNLESFLQNEYISEIVIMDDATDDYDKLVAIYGLNHNKVKLYRQPVNVGSFKNKVAVASLATCEWICLLDSDNYADGRYFEPLLQEWDKNGINEKIIYTPSKGLPSNILKDTDVPTKVVTKDEWNQTVPKTWYLNLGNFVFHKSFVPYLNMLEYHQHNCYGLCSIYINWIALKSGFIIKFVDDMAYDHAVHPGSTYMLTSRESDRFNHTFNWVI